MQLMTMWPINTTFITVHDIDPRHALGRNLEGHMYSSKVLRNSIAAEVEKPSNTATRYEHNIGLCLVWTGRIATSFHRTVRQTI